MDVGMGAGVGTAGPGVVKPAARRWRGDRLFFTGMALLMALTVFAGFAPTYFLKSAFDTPALSPVLHVHGLLFTTWILLFVLQTGLVAARRTDLHRRLGVGGAILAAAMLIAGPAAAIESVQRGFTPPGGPPPLVFFVIPMTDMAMFLALVASGLYNRRRSDMHKRLLLLATINLMTAPIARLPGVVSGGVLAFFALTDLLVLACFAYDRASRGRIHPAFLWGGLALIASQPLRLMLGGTDAWLAFARWATQ